jgi:hypothetical protein
MDMLQIVNYISIAHLNKLENAIFSTLVSQLSCPIKTLNRLSFHAPEGRGQLQFSKISKTNLLFV